MTIEGRIATGALFRAHAGFVAGFLSKMGTKKNDIDDLLQDVFLVAHRRGGFELANRVECGVHIDEVVEAELLASLAQRLGAGEGARRGRSIPVERA